MKSDGYRIPDVPRTPRTDHPQASPSKIGLNVKARRKALGLTQGELAERAGMLEGHVALIEQGRRKKLQGDTLVKLATGLEWTVEELVQGTPAQPVHPGHRALEEFIRSRKLPRGEAEAMRAAEQILGSKPDEMVLIRLLDLVREQLRRR